LAISQTILKLLSVEYHKYRLEGDHTQMQRTEDVALAEIARVDLSGLPSHSVEAAGWNLVVGRWYFTLYEQRKEEKTLEQARKSFAEASKVALVDGADARLVDLIKADALLGLGDLARLSSKWEEADEHYKIAVDLTDKHFDRDSQRVRRVIEREAIVQYHMKRWLHAEGLLRRLLDYYNEHSPIGESLPQAQAECMNNYVKMMESRGRGSETESLKAKLSSVQTILPYPTFDPYAF
jgi:tetratricopeptide (TPR) repeat protein